jgi:hypothetical protein
MGQPLDFSQAHYIKGLYNSLAPEIIVIGGTQVMKTEWLLIDHLAMAYEGFPVFFVLRNGEARDAYVHGRINSVLDAVDLYRKVKKDAVFNRVDIKRFNKGNIKYVGSNVESEFREYPAAGIYVDELNDCNWDNVKFGFSRLDGNIYKFKRFVSNSKTKESPAEVMFEQSTKQHWKVPCLGCGNLNELDWFKTVVKPIEDSNGNTVDYVLRDTEWRIGCGRDIVCVCPKCGGALQRLSDKGFWIPENPGAQMEGFHIPTLCSFMASTSELWREFQPAINDPHEMQRFFIRRLALPYAAVGSKVNSNIMDRCKGTYDFIIHPDRAFIAGDSHPGPCSMGVDVNSEQLDVRISEVLNGNRRKAVFIGKISTRNIEELNTLIDKYNVEKVCIDIQPEQALVTEFQEQCRVDVWLVKLGKSGLTKEESRNYNRRIISPNRTEVLDRTYAQIQTGKNILPANYMDIFNGLYYDEMSSPVREMRLDINGNAFHVWESNGRDHQRFADAYDYLAAKMMSEETMHIGMDCVFDPSKG